MLTCAVRPNLPSPDRLGLVVVDHGSRRVESNTAHEQLVRDWAATREYCAVEPADMELAEPTISDAFTRCVEQGATTMVVAPYFLGPGRHWDRDIPTLAAEAAAAHPGVRWLVSAPLGPDPRLLDLLEARVAACAAHAEGTGDPCAQCTEREPCRYR